MVLVVSFIAFEAIAVATVLPVVVRHLGGIRLYGWAFSAFMLAQLVGIVVAGPLVDRIGMLRPTLVAVALFSAGLLVDGAAPSMSVLVGGRVVQGARGRRPRGGPERPRGPGLSAARCGPGPTRPCPPPG